MDLFKGEKKIPDPAPKNGRRNSGSSFSLIRTIPLVQESHLLDPSGFADFTASKEFHLFPKK